MYNCNWDRKCMWYVWCVCMSWKIIMQLIISYYFSYVSLTSFFYSLFLLVFLSRSSISNWLELCWERPPVSWEGRKWDEKKLLFMLFRFNLPRVLEVGVDLNAVNFRKLALLMVFWNSKILTVYKNSKM
jgi:hypothetical protein